MGVLLSFWAGLLVLAGTCRRFAAANNPYVVLDHQVLGDVDVGVTAGNPMTGFFANPTFFNYDPSVTSIDSSMDSFYLGLNAVMMDDPDVVGMESAFNWTAFEEILDTSAARNRHAVVSFMVHRPGRPLYLPQFLYDANVTLYNYTSDNGETGLSPDYGEPMLLRAIENFVRAFGAAYDGDRRIGIISLALLGYWGEWHTHPNEWVPEFAKRNLVQWYEESFSRTRLQGRFPYDNIYAAGYGLYDGSFAANTLDGEVNGGQDVGWYFWPRVVESLHDDFPDFAPMGGEVRPEIQDIIFTSEYPAGTYEHQPFDVCVNVTRSSFMFFQNAFIDGGYTGDQLDRTAHAHVRMGYNFYISRVTASVDASTAEVILAVTVEQIGIAPYYYPISLLADCAGLQGPKSSEGLNALLNQGDSATFLFGLPATTTCLDEIRISIASSEHLYPGRPIKFAQGDGSIQFSIPLPTTAPSSEPSSIPSLFPSIVPSVAPSAEPSAELSAEPSADPSSEPSSAPSAAQSIAPSIVPSASPSAAPSETPSAAPSSASSLTPSIVPSVSPSAFPSAEPSSAPSGGTSASPSAAPSTTPSIAPSIVPTTSPSATPSAEPSAAPSTAPSPTPNPTLRTNGPTRIPTKLPSTSPSASPSSLLSSSPTKAPTVSPTEIPTLSPQAAPTLKPTVFSTVAATAIGSSPSPTNVHSASPTPKSSSFPSDVPTASPTEIPTLSPQAAPTPKPTVSSTVAATAISSSSPLPSASPTPRSSSQPTSEPTSAPNMPATSRPTVTLTPPTTTPLSNVPTTTPTSPISRPIMSSSYPTQTLTNASFVLYDTGAGTSLTKLFDGANIFARSHQTIVFHINDDLVDDVEFRYGSTVHRERIRPYSMGGDKLGSMVPVTYLSYAGYKSVNVTVLDYDEQVMYTASVNFVVDEIHGFNVHELPDLMELADNMYEGAF